MCPNSYVCIYYIYICIYIYTHMHWLFPFVSKWFHNDYNCLIWADIHVYLSLPLTKRVNTCVHIYTYVCKYLYICIHIYIYTKHIHREKRKREMVRDVYEYACRCAFLLRHAFKRLVNKCSAHSTVFLIFVC